MSLGDAGTPIVLTANTILSGNTTGAITLGGTVNGAYSLTVNTTGTTTLSGDIGGSTALTTLTTNTGGTTVISVDIETSSTQTYNDAVTINGTLDFTGSTVQFANTLAGDDGTGDNLTISGALDLDGAATSLTSLTVEGTSNLGADVTTSSTQTYSGAVVLSNDVTLTTTDSNITFAVTVDGDGTARDLTIDMDNMVYGADGTVQFANTVGANNSLDVIDITGNLNLDAAITNTTSLSVSGTSNLGADVTTSSNQTYSGDATISNDITLTTTNSNVSFAGTTNVGTAGDELTIAAGSGDVTFTGTVGGSTAMGNLTITTGALSAAAIKVQGTIDITNTDTSSITGIISDGASSAILTKAGSGTLLLSANNTYTGQTNINAGTVSITHNNALGSTGGATIIASGASLSISNDITSPENITINGTGISSNGAIRNTADDNTLTGLITLGANSEIQIDTGSSLTLKPYTGSAVTGAYNLTIDSVGTSTISDPIAISTGN